jgi:hypothetical protein
MEIQERKKKERLKGNGLPCRSYSSQLSDLN